MALGTTPIAATLYQNSLKNSKEKLIQKKAGITIAFRRFPECEA
jgi:hypothetical protein